MNNEELWHKAVAFHGHQCPGLAIGFAASLGAIAELGLDASRLPATDEEIVCVTENDACGVDAIQTVLGCTYGKANLVPRLRGKMAFSFFTRPRQGPTSGAAAPNQAAAIGKAAAVIGEVATSIDKKVTSPLQAVRLCLKPEAGQGLERAEFQHYLLATPHTQLFDISTPDYILPQTARLFASHPCVVCGEKTAEPFLRVDQDRLLCLDCYEGYDREGF
ncbi:MAG: FmdE family protein [Coriobacteriales bacterium]|jgi:formylmethanofuran dehydrogenase subunit E|nr:FmdE family protein [Coriobacteriales bacterium]